MTSWRLFHLWRDLRIWWRYYNQPVMRQRLALIQRPEIEE